MKKFILIAGAATLAACTPNEGGDAAAEENAVDETAMEETAMEETAAMLAPDGGPIEGSYQVTAEDGTTWTTTIDADGNYSQVMDGETTESGTMMMQDADTACFDNAADEEGPVCSDSMISEDGTWTASNAELGSVTVVRLDN